MPGHGERIVQTYEDWFVRINKRVQRLERRLARVGSSSPHIVWTTTVSFTSFNATTFRASQAITFPSGTFTAAPLVFVNYRITTPDTAAANGGTATTSGVTIYAYRQNGGTMNVDVLAVQA